jgi:hypothetical protein
MELSKKKRHKPMRILIQEIPELLQRLKPCWMMSPLSVSQMVDAKNILVNFISLFLELLTNCEIKKMEKISKSLANT